MAYFLTLNSPRPTKKQVLWIKGTQQHKLILPIQQVNDGDNGDRPTS